MNKIFFHSLTFLFIILYGCTFEPSGEHFEELDSTGKLPEIEVDLNFATDTIYINKSEWLYFSYKLNGDQVNWAQFTIAGKETSQFEDKNGGVELRWYFEGKETGTYPMEMKIFTKSQTGSIADKIGGEGFLIAHTWILVIKDRYEMGVKMDKVEFIDGSLKVSWEMFKGMDFKSYKIYRDMDYVQQNRVLVATINSQEQTSYVDNNYHGERSRYSVVTNDEFYSSSIPVTGPLPELSATNTPSGDIQLAWKKPPFYKNLKGYRISFRDEKGIIQKIADIDNTAIESFVIPNPRFAFNYELYLTMIPLSNNFYDEWSLSQFLSSNAKATYGKTTPGFRFAIGGLGPMSYLMNDYTGVLIFDHEKFAMTRQIMYGDDAVLHFDVSANNRYLVSVLSSPRKIFFEDMTEPTNNKKIDLSGSFPLMGHIVSVSNVGTGVILNDQTAVLYDYLNERKLAEINLIYNGLYANKIASSGNFFLCETYNGYEFYQYKDNQIIRLQEYNENRDYVLHADYLPGSNEKLVRAFSNRIEVLDCNTWWIEKRWQFPDPITEVYNLDMKSGKLFLRQENQLILFDVMNGTKEVLITTGESYYLNKWTLFYNNGQIIWGEGKGVDLNSKN